MQKKFLLRISPKLYEQLERWAQEELRSVNGQIEFLLREAVHRRRPSQNLDDLTESEGGQESDD